MVDGYTRECRALEADTSFASQRVSRVLDGAMADREKPVSFGKLKNSAQNRSRLPPL